jgi:hypothetical protein
MFNTVYAENYVVGVLVTIFRTLYYYEATSNSRMSNTQ